MESKIEGWVGLYSSSLSAIYQLHQNYQTSYLGGGVVKPTQ